MAMNSDPIVEEVRRIREQLAAKFDFDLARIIADARQRQAASGHAVLAQPSKLNPTTMPTPEKPISPLE
jgi:hypothetical protein